MKNLNMVGLIKGILTVIAATIAVLTGIPALYEAFGSEAPTWIPGVIAVLTAISSFLVGFSVDKNKNQIPDVFEGYEVEEVKEDKLVEVTIDYKEGE